MKIIYSMLINIVFITLMCMFVSCSSNKAIVRNYADSIPNHSEIAFFDYWSAVLCVSPETVKNLDITNEQLEFPKAIKIIKFGQYFRIRGDFQ